MWPRSLIRLCGLSHVPARGMSLHTISCDPTQAEARVKELIGMSIGVKVVTIGKKAATYFKCAPLPVCVSCRARHQLLFSSTVYTRHPACALAWPRPATADMHSLLLVAGVLSSRSENLPWMPSVL